MSNSIIEGLLVTLTDDMGPRICVNISELDETLSHKVGMIGMTVLMLGNSDPHLFAQRHFKLLGPLPIPLEVEKEKVLEAVAIIWNVKADLPTNDPRATEFGRETIVWFIFQTKNREKIYSLTKIIEKTSIDVLKDITKESQTENNDFFKKMLKIIQNNTSEGESTVSSPKEVEKPIAIEYSNQNMYKYDEEHDMLIPLKNLDEIEQIQILILVDMKEKQINIVQLSRDIKQRILFFVSQVVSNFNSNKLKSEYTVRNVIDEFEIMMLLEKIKK